MARIWGDHGDQEGNYDDYYSESEDEDDEEGNWEYPAYTGPGFQLDPTDPNGLSGIFISESQTFIERKIRGFEELLIRATELERMNVQNIDYNKDRQESAMYAFTIVTIVFLKAQ